MYELVIVTTAPGVRLVGPAVLEHTWFEGFAWRIALCAACLQHVGWRYYEVTGTRGFFGLSRHAVVESLD